MCGSQVCTDVEFYFIFAVVGLKLEPCVHLKSLEMEFCRRNVVVDASSYLTASKTKNRDILKKKYGIDCGKHCTNKVVEDAAKDQVDKQKKHHEEMVLEGAHDEVRLRETTTTC